MADHEPQAEDNGGVATATDTLTVTDNRTGTPARGREIAVTFRKNFN